MNLTNADPSPKSSKVRGFEKYTQENPHAEFAGREMAPDEGRQQNRCGKTPESAEKIEKCVDDQLS